ncbi:MAG: PEGA domain-containing protein [Pseudomonadota bacterium]
MSPDHEHNVSGNTTPNTSTIEAVKFTPSDDSGKSRRLKPGHYIALLAITLAALVFWFLFTSKSVQMSFSPPAQTMQVEGGFAFELGGVYLLREGDYRMQATAELHHPLDINFSVGSARNQTQTFSFVPLPGTLALNLSPADAQVTVDGQPVTLIEADGRHTVELAAGEHTLRVSHPRYLPTRMTVTIEGKQIVQQQDIALAPNWANVTVVSEPAGANVWLDGVEAGRTPATIEALAGEREISITMDGFKSSTQRIFAQAGVAQTLETARLVQADAQLQISSTPNAAGVTVNGNFIGRTPISLDLKSGQQHTIAVINNGYKTYTHRTRMDQGEVQKLHATLVREQGEVVFRTEPADALLSINGRPRGAANQTLLLPIDNYTVDISLDGYAGFSQTITPKAGLTQEVKVRLLTHAEARLQALKPTITTQAGQLLRLFEPFDLTLGASRREPGRRANETLREVKLDKLFYLATHEVTNAQFRQFASGHDSLKFVESSLNDDDMPVANLGWHDAAAYCNWLSAQENLPQFYNIEFGKVTGVNPSATGYRLPTEAEWAWAARTESKPAELPSTPQQQLRFPWGKNLPPPDRQGNYADRAASTLVGRVIFGYNDNHAVAAPVGTFKANSRGLYDMGGNVAEWTHDFYEIPNQDITTNPLGPESGEYRVIRGSSWMHGTITELRYSFRDYGIDGRADVGFRLARYAE